MLAAYIDELDCLKHLIAKGANLEAADEVCAASPAAPSTLQPRLPPLLLPRRHRRRLPRVAPPPRLRRTAGRPS